MNFLEKLRNDDPSSPVAYHLEGLLESQENIRSLLGKLSADSPLDPENAAEITTLLQVEIFTHLAFHMKELSRPLGRLIEAAYKDLPGIGEEEGLERLRRLLLQRRIELEGKLANEVPKPPALKRAPRRPAKQSV